jgi:hypothetical protein
VTGAGCIRPPTHQATARSVVQAKSAEVYAYLSRMPAREHRRYASLCRPCPKSRLAREVVATPPEASHAELRAVGQPEAEEPQRCVHFFVSPKGTHPFDDSLPTIFRRHLDRPPLLSAPVSRPRGIDDREQHVVAFGRNTDTSHVVLLRAYATQVLGKHASQSLVIDIETAIARSWARSSTSPTLRSIACPD